MAFTSFREWLEALHAQPRFGAGDRAGTANYIDAAARARGVASVTTGEPVSLARALPPDPAITAGGHPGFTIDVEVTGPPEATRGGTTQVGPGPDAGERPA